MKGRLPWIAALLVPAAIAVWCFARTLDGGFLSDDFLLSSLYADDPHAGVEWSKVRADFVGPWFGLEAPLYRPLLTLSFALDITLHGPAPFGYHLTNLLLHVAAVCSTAVVAAVLATPAGKVCVVPNWRPVFAAVAAGSFVAAHPVAVESVGWVAARNSGLEVAFRNVALALFALQLARPTRTRTIGAIAFAACALASKESAVLLAPSILAIDWIHRPAAPLRARLRSCGPILALVALYFVGRTLLFGTPLGSAGGTEVETDYVGIATSKAAMVFWPESGAFELPVFGAAGLAITYFCLVLALRARSWVVALAGALWFAATLAPTYALKVFPEFGGSRLILDSTHVAAVLLAAWLFAPAARRALQIPAFAALLITAIAMAVGPTAQRVDRYESAWDEIRAAMPPLRALCEDVRDERPLALVGMPQTPSVPPLNQNCWFPLTERPFQRFDYPMVSLGYLTVTVPGAESLLGDASAAAALWHAGSTIATWSPSTSSFVTAPSKSTLPNVELTLTREGDQSFRFASPIHAMACEAVRVRVDDGVELASLELAPIGLSPESAPGWRFEVREPSAAPNGTEFDLTHSMLPSFLASAGAPLHGFTLRAQDAKGRSIPTSTIEVTARARLERIEPPRAPPFFGTVDELDQRLRGPSSTRPLRLVLLGPQGAIACPLEADGTFRLTDSQRELLDVIAGFSRSARFYGFFESTPDAPGPHVRSDLGAPIVLRPRGR